MKSANALLTVAWVALLLLFSSLEACAQPIATRQEAIPMKPLAHLGTVEVFINDQGPYTLVVDTGASVTVLDTGLVASLGLAVVGTTEVGSPMGPKPLEVDSLQVDRLRLGSAVLENTPAVAMELGSVFGSLEAPDGILAAGRFDGFLFTIDFPNSVVLVREGKLPPADGKRVLDYDTASTVPKITVDIADRVVTMAIDSGAPSMFVLPNTYVSTLPLETEPTVVGQGRTVDATFDVVAAQLEGAVSIGDIEIDRPTLTFNETRPPHMGVGVLQQYTLTIDSTHRRVMFEPSEGSPSGSAPAARRVVRGGGGTKSYGLMLAGISGDFIGVRGTEEGSVAERAGLRSGDRIVAMNGRPVESMSQDDRVGCLRGSPLVLGVERDGEVIEITMEHE